jgi:hypothetical protein
MSAGVIVEDAIAWEPHGPRDTDAQRFANEQRAAIGRFVAIVWHVGGEYSHRSKIRETGQPAIWGRTVSHFSEAGALRAAEKRLRKAAS